MRPAEGRRLRVLAVVDGHQVTGPAKQVLGGLLRLGPDVNPAVAVVQRAPSDLPLVAAVRGLGLPYLVLRERFRFDPGPVLELARYMRRSRVDVLETHGYKANVLGGLVATLLGVPWIAFLHGETQEGWKVRTYFRLERIAARRATRVAVVSHAMRELAIRSAIPAPRVRVIHNACLERPKVAAVLGGVAAPVIGVIARLSREKGVDVALRTHARVLMKHPAAKMIIAGIGPEQPKLAGLARTLRVEDSIEWLGYQPDISAVFARLMVLLLPSRSEGLPNVVLEAMAHGVPVVAAAVGGVSEVVLSGRTGLLVTPDDEVSMAAGVMELLEDAGLRRRLAERAQHDVKERFSADGRAGKLAALYAEVTA